MKTYLTTFLLISLNCIIQSQKTCPNCTISNSTAFTCNNLNCDSFLWPNSSTPYDLRCKGGSSSNCYYLSGFESTSKMYKFTACNYTFASCSYCSDSNSCSGCYSGSLVYIKDVENQYKVCKKCNDVIPGCMMCDRPYSCTQCESQYLAIGGLCYQKDAKTLAGNEVQNDSQTGIEVGVILMTVFTFIALVMGGYAFRIWVKKQRYQPLMEQNQ